MKENIWYLYFGERGIDREILCEIVRRFEDRID